MLSGFGTVNVAFAQTGIGAISAGMGQVTNRQGVAGDTARHSACLVLGVEYCRLVTDPMRHSRGCSPTAQEEDRSQHRHWRWRGRAGGRVNHAEPAPEG